jgi:serine/threonine protein kinase
LEYGCHSFYFVRSQFFLTFDIRRLAGYPPFGDDSFEDIKKGEFTFDDDPWADISKQGKKVSNHVFLRFEAKDLISKLLTVNPSKRFTVAQIFAHPWMKVRRFLINLAYLRKGYF